MVGGRVAEVCCSIVAGGRWTQTFLGVVDLWEVGAEADLRTSAVDWGVLEAWKAVEKETSYADLVTGSGTCPVLSPIQKDGPLDSRAASLLSTNQFPRRFSSRALRMTVKFHTVHM
jgi:hypothetical protein